MKILIDVAVEPAALAALQQSGRHDIEVITPPAEIVRPLDAAAQRGGSAFLHFSADECGGIARAEMDPTRLDGLFSVVRFGFARAGCPRDEWARLF